MLDPQAVSPMARHTANGHARFMVRPVARRIASLLSCRGDRPPRAPWAAGGLRDGTGPAIPEVGTTGPTSGGEGSRCPPRDRSAVLPRADARLVAVRIGQDPPRTAANWSADPAGRRRPGQPQGGPGRRRGRRTRRCGTGPGRCGARPSAGTRPAARCATGPRGSRPGRAARARRRPERANALGVHGVDGDLDRSAAPSARRRRRRPRPRTRSRGPARRRARVTRSGGVGREDHVDDVRIAKVDVGMVAGSVGGLGDGGHQRRRRAERLGPGARRGWRRST